MYTIWYYMYIIYKDPWCTETRKQDTPKKTKSPAASSFRWFELSASAALEVSSQGCSQSRRFVNANRAVPKAATSEPIENLHSLFLACANAILSLESTGTSKNRQSCNEPSSARPPASARSFLLLSQFLWDLWQRSIELSRTVSCWFCTLHNCLRCICFFGTPPSLGPVPGVDTSNYHDHDASGYIDDSIGCMCVCVYVYIYTVHNITWQYLIICVYYIQ